MYISKPDWAPRCRHRRDGGGKEGVNRGDKTVSAAVYPPSHTSTAISPDKNIVYLTYSVDIYCERNSLGVVASAR